MWYVACTNTASTDSPSCFETSHKLEIAATEFLLNSDKKTLTLFHSHFQNRHRVSIHSITTKNFFFFHSNGDKQHQQALIHNLGDERINSLL